MYVDFGVGGGVKTFYCTGANPWDKMHQVKGSAIVPSYMQILRTIADCF